MTKIVNLFAGPGAGKSTTALGLAFLLKLRPGLRTEYVPEYAKELAFADRLDKVGQKEIFVEQKRRQLALIDKVDWIVTDSPLLLSLVYSNDDMKKNEVWRHHVYSNSLKIKAHNFVISRWKPYETYGRTQTKAEAKEKDIEVQTLLGSYNVDYILLEGDANAPMCIMNFLIHIGEIEKIEGDFNVRQIE